ncbi:MAG: aconitase/3-isopropylmalate dehydratase large subunit family protein [Acidobacteriota bacterium]|jgi:3-isopropylmalate/(R)-2-methylmalate dehydratase large subunit
MGQTIAEKILAAHGDREMVRPGDILDVFVDSRVARDFGGANVVKNLEEHGLSIADPSRTFFTFDCNPTGSDQNYAANQQRCRLFAARCGIKVFDIDRGIGTHLAVENGLAWPGSTFVSTDSHANILGAVGAFGQGMGDQDIAAAWAHGKIWFKVPPTVRIVLEGTPSPSARPKDVVLRLLKHFGANGLLGCAAELYGPYVDSLDLAGRITMASLATEMGAIILLFPPSQEVIEHCRKTTGRTGWAPVFADADAAYEREESVDVEGLGPMVARPGHPEDVVSLDEVRGRRIHSVFIGSCTNGTYEDLAEAATVLEGKHKADGVVLKIVPSTDRAWRRAMESGLFETLKAAGALISNAGCGGCAAGQVGQNGPGEVTVSTGNRNFAGKQGKGEVYLASPAVAAASAVAGFLTDPDHLDPSLAKPEETAETAPKAAASPAVPAGAAPEKPLVLHGRVWIIPKDNIDTDMIFHNRHLAVTELSEMGRFAFGNLEGWEDFPQKTKPGDIVVTGANFGAGSSRQQAVDCFKALNLGAIVARSFGAIYERNAINAGLPIVQSDLIEAGLSDGEEITLDLLKGEIIRKKNGDRIAARPWPQVQASAYGRGGLLG